MLGGGGDGRMPLDSTASPPAIFTSIRASVLLYLLIVRTVASTPNAAVQKLEWAIHQIEDGSSLLRQQ